MATPAPLWAIKRIVEEGLNLDDFRAEPLDKISDIQQTWGIYTPSGDFVLRFHASINSLQDNMRALVALQGLDVAPEAVSAGRCEGLAYTFEKMVPGTHFPYKDIASKERILPSIIKRLMLFKKANIAELEAFRKPGGWVRTFLKRRLQTGWSYFPNQEIIRYIEMKAPQPGGHQLVHGEPYWSRMLFNEGKIRFVHFNSAVLGEPETDAGVLTFITPISDDCLKKMAEAGGLKIDRILYHALLFGVKAYLGSEEKKEERMQRIEELFARR